MLVTLAGKAESVESLFWFVESKKNIEWYLLLEIFGVR